MVQDVAVVVYDEGVAIDAELKRQSGLKTSQFPGTLCLYIFATYSHIRYVYTYSLSSSSLGERHQNHLPLQQYSRAKVIAEQAR